MSTTAAPTPRSRSRALPADALDVQVVSLSRNFGKEAALMAGLDHARRGAVLFMDGDGQHPPTLVEKLVGHWIDDGYDVVYTAKAHRDNESFAAPPRRCTASTR
jgi:glycosyltransferase involved in cell wall biosynthesis